MSKYKAQPKAPVKENEYADVVTVWKNDGQYGEYLSITIDAEYLSSLTVNNNGDFVIFANILKWDNPKAPLAKKSIILA